VYSFSVRDQIVQELQNCFLSGPMFDDSGLRQLNEEQIGRIDNMSVQIQSDEHPPPHFHVRFAGENASFALSDGARLPSIKGLEKFEKNIARWYATHRCELILAWNRLRPADCPVGLVEVPPECQPTSVQTGS
jgi:Domain of unknown function (DUF4160)